MPELPEVEMFKRYGERHLLHRKIKKIEIDDQRVVMAEEAAFKELYEHEVISLERWGKYIFGKISHPKLTLILHFGMTGYLKIYSKPSHRPKGTRVSFAFEDGYLAWINPRKFGRIGLVDNVAEFFKSKSIGEDALCISRENFISTFSLFKGAIKSRLMDQKNVAGIGNIYADEILFQCGIHPESESQRLTRSQWEQIYVVMQEVFQVAIDHQALYHTFPEHFLLSDRSEKRSHPTLSRIKVGGRTTYFDQKQQVKY